MIDFKRRLEALAGKDAGRIAALNGRKERARARNRQIACVACGEEEWSHRAPTDICEACLVDLWGAQNVLSGEYDASKKSGLIAVSLAERFHDIEYPALATSGEKVPKKASFARPGSFGETEDSTRTLQHLFHELGAALSQAFPCDPAARADAERLIPGGSAYYDGQLFFRLPADAVKALRDLWYFVRWHSETAYQQGFDAGHDLLSRMNLGGLTHEGFLQEIAKQTESAQRALQKVAKESGETSNRRARS